MLIRSAAEKDDAAAEADKGRPLPTLGAAARIGFCINGEPQGMAFDDLFDFRPLKRLSSAAPSKGKKAAAATAATSLTLVDEDASIITSNSSVASIMKSRENHVDDGALGYFPFATSFGGARVRIVAGQLHVDEDRKSTRLNSSHAITSRMPSSA